MVAIDDDRRIFNVWSQIARLDRWRRWPGAQRLAEDQDEDQNLSSRQMDNTTKVAINGGKTTLQTRYKNFSLCPWTTGRADEPMDNS